MKVFAIVALFVILAVSATMADPWKKDNHWGGHHQHGKIGYKVDVKHGGWGKHDKGWTELYDSRDKSTGWKSHGHDNGYGNGHGHNHGWKN